jgi:hypothetical protein
LQKMGRAARRRILDICDDSRIAARRREYYAGLAAKLCETVHARKTSDVGVVLFDDGADQRRIARAIESVNLQTIEAKMKVYVGDPNRLDSRAADAAASWKIASPESIWDGIATNNPPEVIFIGAADDIIDSDALRMAANHFANHPEDGFVSCWTECDGEQSAAFENDFSDTLAAKLPTRGFFRRSALVDCGPADGRDNLPANITGRLAARIAKKGWRCGCVAYPLVHAANRHRR